MLPREQSNKGFLCRTSCHSSYSPNQKRRRYYTRSKCTAISCPLITPLWRRNLMPSSLYGWVMVSFIESRELQQCIHFWHPPVHDECSHYWNDKPRDFIDWHPHGRALDTFDHSKRVTPPTNFIHEWLCVNAMRLCHYDSSVSLPLASWNESVDPSVISWTEGEGCLGQRPLRGMQ